MAGAQAPAASTHRPHPRTTSLVAQTVKRLPTVREAWLWSLDQEDPLDKEMASHSSTPAWKIPWMEERSRLPSMGSQSRTQLSNFISLFFSCPCYVSEILSEKEFHPLSYWVSLKSSRLMWSSFFSFILWLFWASLIVQLVKNPPAMQETLVRFLGQEDPLEKG